MKYLVKVDDYSYEVELGDLHTQPIIALVNGEPVEVFLESEGGVKPYFALHSPEPAVAKAGNSTPKLPDTTVPTPVSAEHSANDQLVVAPIPGVIISVAVKPGEAVTTGQVLCVLEAMKMKNTIRAAGQGVIAAVHVNPGETVMHGAPLLEYEA